MRKLELTCCFVLMTCISAFSQSALVSSGGDHQATNCSVSYSVGQPFYSLSENEAVSVIEGVQQPYDISVVFDVTKPSAGEQPQPGLASGFSVELSAYPNPTDDMLNLLVVGDNLSEMSCQVYDVNGRLLSEQSIFKGETSLDMRMLPPATYFVSVSEAGRQLKVFKIIKK